MIEPLLDEREEELTTICNKTHASNVMNKERIRAKKSPVAEDTMQHVDMPLDQVILDMSELETLLSRLSSTIAEVQPTSCQSERVILQWLELLCRVQESSEALNELARTAFQRQLAAELEVADEMSATSASGNCAELL